MGESWEECKAEVGEECCEALSLGHGMAEEPENSLQLDYLIRTAQLATRHHGEGLMRYWWPGEEKPLPSVV